MKIYTFRVNVWNKNTAQDAQKNVQPNLSFLMHVRAYSIEGTTDILNREVRDILSYYNQPALGMEEETTDANVEDEYKRFPRQYILEEIKHSGSMMDNPI